MDELVTKHSQIMDRYDPDHKVDLLVDEWGTWFDVEPGTNPGFLYQQNTMRDAHGCRSDPEHLQPAQRTVWPWPTLLSWSTCSRQ